ncbi:Na+/H+ antiporter [Enterococcus haemoperoxidus ATCC BAA-382]|uniref:Na+/H+ antiporter n=1 Tax=Enterococcus haemoperoxidus ATCC BAA-382 TaxID=1158608 RepID=R2QQ01_9ENTE|nr:sodium:proton antiporter [Enterococcus haemoperoxidus]EOH98587.1 Na+/H+ antiporter [Enterococcus haemoperoxidus ATCC BAA-382]EOT62230.1 Na+/H+ antiporter [Enterococcus haemoperoxidus ATCC BAA-382]OJG55688.1 Na+/H+ antiporter [Enterococcus haemoperoxidus]
MGFVYLIIVFAFAITFSNVFNRIVPIIPLPIVQIIVGVLIGLTDIGREIVFEPEIFLVMIIAPLLFREGERNDISATMKNFSVILFLAFIGVLITLVSVGWALHMVIPALPIAACFALGAALGPTDAVAVGSLSGKIQIPPKAMHILEGEGLINDASGVTAFQFALAALLTGSFSAADAGITLVVSSIGGAIVGAVLVMIKRQVVMILEKASARDVTGYLLLELLLPFLAYMVAELFDVSGIIAAVVAGVMQAASFKKISLFEAELSSVSESTWGTITFMLNALVFLFLGIELSQVFSPIWNSETYSNSFLMVVILILSVTLFVARFFSIFLIYSVKNGLKNVWQSMNEMLILTFGGVKGTVSLATIFILPLTLNGQAFPERSLLLFITACVILVTLVGGILVLPFLTESDEIESTNVQGITLLQDVIERLKKINQDDPHVEMNVVIENYQDRVKELYTEQLPSDQRQEVQELRALIVSIERDGLEESFRQKEIGIEGYRLYERLISRMERSIARQLLSIIGFWLLFVRQIIAFFVHPNMLFGKKDEENRREFQKEELENVRQVFLQNTEVILKSLDNLKGVYDEEIIQFFIDGRLQFAHRLEDGTFIDSFIVRSQSNYAKELLIGYQEERRVIDEYELSEKISSFEANEYRKNVNLLESYSINDVSNTIPLRKLTRELKKEADQEN